MYCEDHSTPLPQEIERHKKFTRENFLDADKMVSSLEVRPRLSFRNLTQAQLFIFLAKDRHARRGSRPSFLSTGVNEQCWRLDVIRDTRLLRGRKHLKMSRAQRYH